jgi:hypothetical protein
VFITSAEVLARAGEEEDEDVGGSGEKVGAAGGSGGWTKRQYREEGEKLRGKEWVFQ